MKDGVEIAHQHEGDRNLILDGSQLTEELLQGHAVAESLGGSTLDDGAVGEGIAEGDAHLDHGNATTLHGEDDVGCAVERRTASTEIERQELPVLAIFE